VPDENYDFSPDLRVFRGCQVPEGVRLCGYGALIHAFDLAIPLPRMVSGAKPGFAELSTDDWQLLFSAAFAGSGFRRPSDLRAPLGNPIPADPKALFQKTLSRTSLRYS
jgi:hypothetical protein